MNLKHNSRFDFFKEKNIYYIKPCEDGNFMFSEKKSKPNRLYANDKGVSNQIKKVYGIGEESFMLSISEKPVTIGNEDNCFSLNK